MNIAIFGIGAMGCLFGARLSPHARVTLIGHWQQQIETLQKYPLRVITPEGREQEARLQVIRYDDPLLDDVDVALILVKAHQTAQAAEAAARILRHNGLVLTLQNGLGNLEIISQKVGPERTVLGITTLGAFMEGPGTLREGGTGITHLATQPRLHMQIQAVAMLFEQGGLHTEIVDDVTSLMWGKLALNAGLNPLTALLRVPNGGLLQSGYARGLMGDAAREVAEVATAQGITLPFPDPAARLEEVARLTAHNHSSMLQDVLRGSPTEIEAISGAVTREGERLGIPTPVNELLYRLVRALEGTFDHRLE